MSGKARQQAGQQAGRGASGRKPARKKEFTPLSDGKKAVLAFGAAHPALVCLGSAMAVIAMGVLLVWFDCFSGYNAPAQFIYAGF